MRILEIETFGRGGLAHYAYNLSCALAERGHEVTLLTAAEYELADNAVPAGVRLVQPIARLARRVERKLPSVLGRLVRRAEAIVDAVNVARLVRQSSPDVVHFHCTTSIALVYVELLRRTGVPLAVTAHVVTPHERSRLMDAVFGRVYRMSPLVIAHSEFDRRRLHDELRIELERVAVMPHGEYGFFARQDDVPNRKSARERLGVAPDAEVALFFGYIREYKGLDTLLEAWPTVQNARPAARLLVAGDPVRLDPARREELEQWTTRIGGVARFEYIPFSHVAQYFAAADVLAMPYRHISQSGVLFLALSLGVPIVASTVGAIPEVLTEGENALLIPPDSPEALAKALTRALESPTLRARLASGGQTVASAHAWPQIAAKTEAALEALRNRAV